MTVKQQVLDFIHKRQGGVSFAELSREVVGFNGDMELTTGPDSNIILWAGVSTEASDALDELRSSGAIHAHPTTPMVYMIDGMIPRLPVATRIKAYAKPHWLPVVFNLGPMPPPPPKVYHPKPNQIPQVKPFDITALSAGDLRAMFEPLELCPNGFNDNAGECAKGWGHYDSSPKAAEEFARQVAHATEWLSLCGQRKTINNSSSSYGLKHEAERWGRSHPNGGYVSNGALLMAAYALGFRIQRPGGYRNFPNAYLNISNQRPA